MALLGTIVVIVLSAGCAASPQNGAHSSTNGGATMPETNHESSAANSDGIRTLPLASSLPTDTQALPVLSAEQVEGLCPLSWKEVSTQSDGRHITIVVTATAQSIKGVQISEAHDEVVLEVYGIPHRGTYTAGPLVHTLALIELPTALGARRLAGPPASDCAY